MVRSFVAQWLKITRPADHVVRAEDRLRVQLLASLLLLLIFIATATSLLLWYKQSLNLGINLLLLVVLLISFAFSRTPYHRYAALVSVIAVTFEPFLLIIVSPENQDTLFFVLVGILMGGVVLSSVQMAALVIVSNIALLLVPFLRLGVPASAVDDPLLLNLTATAIILIVNTLRHQGQLHREQRARTLAESELHYRLMAENATDMIARHRADGMFLYVSPAARALLGYEPVELIGRYPNELFHPDDIPMMYEALRTVVKGTDLSISTYRIRRKDGHYIWFETTSKAVRIAGSGVAQEMTTVSRDVSARKEAEERLKTLTGELEEQKNILDTLLTVTPDQLAIFDREGRYVYANSMALHGLQLPDVVGKTYYDLGFAPEVCERFDREKEVVFSTGEVISDVWLQYPTPEGVCDLEYTYSPVTDSRDHIIALVSTSRDVTVRRQAEQERLQLAVERERVKTLQHLISDTSHDLKTPLTTLNNSLYLLKKFISDPERRDHYAQVLQTQVSHLVKILEDMDSMAKLDRATEEFAFQVIDLNRLLTQIVAEHEALAMRKNQHLTFTPRVDVPPVLGDLTKIRRAITNLLVNALNYTPDDGSVTVRVFARDPEAAVIEIQDTGVGIRPEELSLIFERFYRSQNTASSAGSGLGLAITKKIIEAHAGRIEVDSVPGEGSTFRVILLTSNPLT